MQPNVSNRHTPAGLGSSERDADGLPYMIAETTVAPAVPAPIVRDYPVHLVVDMTSENKLIQLTPTKKYPAWTFSGSVPGPFVRARVGDVLEVRHSNLDVDGLAHNIDFHAVSGPGGECM